MFLAGRTNIEKSPHANLLVRYLAFCSFLDCEQSFLHAPSTHVRQPRRIWLQSCLAVSIRVGQWYLGIYFSLAKSAYQEPTSTPPQPKCMSATNCNLQNIRFRLLNQNVCLQRTATFKIFVSDVKTNKHLPYIFKLLYNYHTINMQLPYNNQAITIQLGT